MDITWGLCVIGGAWVWYKNYSKISIPKYWILFVLGFSAWGLVSLLFANQPFNFSSAFELRWSIEFILAYGLFSQLKLDSTLLRKFSFVFLFLCTVSFILYFYGWSENQGEMVRAGGIFNSPMPFSQSIGPLSVFFLSLLLFNKKEGRIVSGALLLSSVLSLSLVVLTYTRGVWLSIFVTIPVLLWVWNKQKFKYIFPALVLSLGIVLSFNKTVADRITYSFRVFQNQASYDNERLNLWKANWDMFLDNPVSGVGFNQNKTALSYYFKEMSLPDNYFKSHAHNQYLQILGGMGFPGFGFYICSIIIFLYYALKSFFSTNNPDIKMFAAAAAFGMLTFYISSFTESNFNIAKNRFVLFFFWLIALKVYTETFLSKSTPPIGNNT